MFFVFVLFCCFFFLSLYRALHLTAGLPNASDLLELLLSFNADVDAMNDDVCTPLFYSTQSNNLYAASLLLNHGKTVDRDSTIVYKVSHFRISSTKGKVKKVRVVNRTTGKYC